MEPREKKKRKTNCKKSRIQSIPTDLTIEILSRLPEKSVARFSCVSKLWSSITSDPSFPRSRLLLCFQKHNDLFISSIPHHNQNSNRSYSSSLSFDHHHMTKLPLHFDLYQSTESVHGLICFVLNNPIVWNPSTRQSITLPAIPTPCKDWKKVELFLGYDPIEGKHKLVCVPYKRTCYVCRVFTLGSSQESWRTVKTNCRHRPTGYTYGQCIEGVIYYLASSLEGDDRVVMSFDVRSEKFDMIRLPSNSDWDVLITYKGRLGLFEIDYGITNRRLWILEDAEKHNWSGQDFLLPFGDLDARSFKLKGFTHAGEFIFVPEMTSQPAYILLCDPVRNSWRKFEFKGIADEVSVHNGVVEEEEEKQDDEHRPMYALLAFPNHIDSQMSL
ncbi:hypothetical protein Bca4012_075847 [Brassica carinata]|uniref:F-box domain-containing protein n=1 Tax=Brassica oleracea TaxID=3712 RepID=A0A3P6EFQ7_BRAOL|nr:unnamed protein product [Brassica oleracea]